MTERHIVAMGGGGFSMEPDNPLLDDYVLKLTGKDRPRVCFVPTASGDSEGYIARFLQAFPEERAEATALTLFRRDGKDLRESILEQDVLYVGGGSTLNMLAVWRAHGVDQILREAYDAGVILAGISAGALCWFEAGVTDSLGAMSVMRDGLGFLPGGFSPHFDGEPERRPLLLQAVADGTLPTSYAADDSVALHFVNESLYRSVASKPGVSSYQITKKGHVAQEKAIETLLLG